MVATLINYWKLAAGSCSVAIIDIHPGHTWVCEEEDGEQEPLDLFRFSGNSPFSDGVLRFIISISGTRKQQFICGHL